jgi:tetratricopeptide (TPR) repeat protein
MKFNLLAITLFASISSHAASIDKAQTYSQFGLIEDAKHELIEVLYEKSSAENKAEALYLLGSIAFDESNIAVALKTWTDLVKNYPSSQQPSQVIERIDVLQSIAGSTSKEKLENAVAQAYLKNADFWSDDRSNVFTIDASWIPKVEASLHWYDKVISEFPNTTAAKVAYQDKLKTLIGWKESGKYGSSYGVRKDFAQYMPMLLETFDSFKQEFPEASTLQAFRYQIAQVYWSQKDWVNTRKWLNEIISTAGDKDSFYSETAKLRLKKIEY